jgi:hypothetical protein
MATPDDQEEIEEITSQMISWGLAAYEAGLHSLDEHELVRAIYTAMAAARNRPESSLA